MKVLDLFSERDGFSLGLEKAGFKIAMFSKIDPFCQRNPESLKCLEHPLIN